MDATSVAPQAWSDWVEALTAMFAPPNLLANFCREIATLRQSNEKHPGESVDQYAFRIISLFTGLYTEAARTTPRISPPRFFIGSDWRLLFLETGYCHRSESNKYERTLLTRSHQRKTELVDTRQINYMVSMLQIYLRSCPRLLLLLKISWKRALTTYRQPSPRVRAAQASQTWSLENEAPGYPGSSQQ